MEQRWEFSGNTDYSHPDGTWKAGMADLENRAAPEAAIRQIFRDNAVSAFGVA